MIDIMALKTSILTAIERNQKERTRIIHTHTTVYKCFLNCEGCNQNAITVAFCDNLPISMSIQCKNVVKLI